MERRLRQANPKQLTEETIVTDNNNTQAGQQPPKPNPALKSRDVLVGMWNVSGPDIQGQVTFEWMEGGFFLVQRVNLEHDGHKIKGIESSDMNENLALLSQTRISDRTGSATRAIPLPMCMK
jgi:hypothetical protein